MAIAGRTYIEHFRKPRNSVAFRVAGTNVVIATIGRHKTKTGEMVDGTERSLVAFFGRLAEIASQYQKRRSGLPRNTQSAAADKPAMWHPDQLIRKTYPEST